MGPLMINMAFMPYMRNVRCHACDTHTHGRTVESSAVFCLSRIRNIPVLKSIVFGVKTSSSVKDMLAASLFGGNYQKRANEDVCRAL